MGGAHWQTSNSVSLQTPGGFQRVDGLGEAMGDFNDEPFDTSLVTHALSTRQRGKVMQATPRRSSGT